LDLSGSLHGAGGVGGLLYICDLASSICYAAAADGNGNVSSLVNTSTGQVAAEYEYSPFGEVIKAVGPMASSNPFRFSTKYQDDETGLLYYGYRYYNPSTGRWMSRDPIEEEGGVNLYGMLGNNPVNAIDPLGLIKVNLKYETHIDTPTVTFAGRIFNGGLKTRHEIVVDTDTKSVSTVAKFIGTTVEYDSTGKAIGTATASGASLLASVDKAGTGTNFKVTMSGNESNPLVAKTVRVTATPLTPAYTYTVNYAPAITYEVRIKFEKCGEDRYIVKWEGSHDRFPSHDYYVNGIPFHRFSHISAGTTPLSLIPTATDERFEGTTVAK
jgi:RHS repeat-associated protein